MIISVVDDADLLDDGNPCTTDVCTNGAAFHDDVTDGTSCHFIGTCISGTCLIL